MLARRANIRPTEAVLDVGCGSGASLIPASSVAAWATGTDVSLDMLEHVPWPVPLAVADGAALPLRATSYDVVLAGFVLQFLGDPAAAIAEWRRVLRPGGRLVVSLPQPEMPGVGDVLASWGRRIGLPPLAPQRAETWVADAFAAAGFTAVEYGADEHTFEFATGDDYVRWQWSHGGRALLSQVPSELVPECEADLRAAAEANRDGDVIPMPTTAHFWVAATPE